MEKNIETVKQDTKGMFEYHVFRKSDGSYPFISSIYAAIRKSESHESMAYKLYQFLFTKKGAEMVNESGYIAIR